MRVGLVFLVVCVLSALVCGMSAADAAAPTRGAARASQPHVIYISLDTTRADYLGCYGNRWVKTPALDQFAQEGVVFENCQSVAPTTLASHTSLFTGKYPHTHGVPRNGFYVNDANVTLAEVLAENGYQTAAFLASFALNGRFNLSQGFAHYDDAYQDASKGNNLTVNVRDAKAVTDATLRYVENHRGEKPLFLFVHYFDPHAPYQPPAPYNSLYDGIVQDGGAAEAEDGPPAEVLEKAERRQLRQLKHYAGEISYMDAHLARLFKGLRAHGVYDDAFILITSDHGESLLDHEPFFSHGYNVHQDTMHLVAMCRFPGGERAGMRVAGLISNIDFYPSTLTWLGLDTAAGVEGLTVDLTADPITTQRIEAYGQATKPFGRVEIEGMWHNLDKARMVRQGAKTFIQVPYKGAEAFYDLKCDPRQQKNRIAEESPGERVDELRGLLETWAGLATPLSTHYERGRKQETQERLEALGYFE
ncbi:MAG: sulfatase [Candidatus Hydrogenedentota bacterium]